MSTDQMMQDVELIERAEAILSEEADYDAAVFVELLDRFRAYRRQILPSDS